LEDTDAPPLVTPLRRFPNSFLISTATWSSISILTVDVTIPCGTLVFILSATLEESLIVKLSNRLTAVPQERGINEGIQSCIREFQNKGVALT
jgi:hypothetical protein